MHQSSYKIMSQFHELAQKHFPNGTIKVLDVGRCGVNGTYKEIFADKNRFEYIGLDLQPGPNVDYVPQDPYGWSGLEDESFDIIVSGQAFEHIEFPWLTIVEIAKKLKHNGLACLVAPSRGPEHKYPVDCWRYYPDGFRALAKWAGLEVLDAKTSWGASGFTDGSDQWGDTFCILYKKETLKPIRKAGRPTLGSKTTGNTRNPLRSDKRQSYYAFVRNEVVDAIVQSAIPAREILEIGCAAGATGKKLKELIPIDQYVGIEISEEAAVTARQHLERVIVADIENTDLTTCGLKQESFDLILALDVLEHLYDPWDALSTLMTYLRPGGHVVASIPNIQNVSVVRNLLKGNWKYEDAGLLDATHLRFFTLDEISALFTGAGLTITRTDCILNPSIDIGSLKATGNSFELDKVHFTDLSKEEVVRFFTYQYLVIAEKRAAIDAGTAALEPVTPIVNVYPIGSSAPKAHSGQSSPPSLKPGKGFTRGLTSIVILTFNQLKYTKECVESIRKHTPEPHEVIFVDNGSTDGTVKWLKKLVGENSNYSLIENGKNLGFAKGCNQGIEASSGEYILLLNNDVVVTQDWLSGMLECLNNAADIGIVGPMTNSISGPQKVEQVGYSSIKQLDTYAKGFREQNRHRRVPTRRIVGFCMLFQNALIEKIGLLDESFGSGNFEDDDLCLRAALEGYRNVIAGDVFIHHYGSRSFVGNKIDYTAAMTRNKKIFNEKWTGVDPHGAIGKRLLTQIALEKANDLNHKDLIGQAIEAYLEALRHSPQDQKVYHALAEALINAKRYQDALDALSAIPPDEQDLRKLELIGYCEEGLELHGEAEEFADRVLSLNPDSAVAINLKGILAYKRGEKDTAENFFQKAVASDPGYAEPYTNLGVLKWAADQKQEGLALLERGFILSPTLMDISTLYHSAVTTEQQFARAETVFREANTLYPTHKRLKFLLIDVLIQQGNYEAAMQLIEQAMVAFGTDDGILAAALEIRGKIGPKTIRNGSTKKRSTLSLCMIVKNEEVHIAKCLASVKPVVDEMIVVDTGSTDRTIDIARSFGAHVYTFEWTNDFSEARNFSLSKAAGDWILVLDADEVVSARDYDLLVKVIETRGSDPTGYSITTRNYVESVNIKGWTANDGVYQQEEAGTGWHPSRKVRMFTNDKRIRFDGRIHELVEPSLNILGITPRECNIPIHHYGHLDVTNTISKGEDYYLLGKAKLDETGTDLKAIVELARQANDLGHYQESRELWSKAIDISPDNPDAFLNIGYAYLELGRFSEALKASENAMRLDDNMKEAKLNYSICELCIGDLKNAIAVLEDLLERVPEYPSAMGLIAAAYCVNDQKDRCLHYINEIRKKGFDCGLAFYDHATRLISAGRIEFAITLLETAIENDFANNDIRSLLDECYKKRDHVAQSEKAIHFPAHHVKGLTSIIIRLSKDLESARQCLHGIRNHTETACEISLIVEETAGPILKWARKLAAEDRNCNYVARSAEQGSVEAINRAMEQSSGEYIVLMDDKVRVTEDWLEGMLECLISSPDIGIVGPMTSNISGLQRVANVSYGSMIQMEEFAGGFRMRNRHRRIPAHIIAGYCMLFKRELAAEIGFLNEDLGSGDLENDDYCLRSSMAGYRNVIAGDVYIHRTESGGHSGYEIGSGLATTRSKRILGEKWGSLDVASITAKKLLALNATEKASEFAHRQHLQEAVATLTNAIEYAPDEKGIYYRLAEILMDAKLFKEAFEALQAMGEGAKGEQRYFELIGYCHEGLNADDEAQSCADRALSLHGTSAAALNLKGVLAYKKGQRSSAEEFFKKSISADPSYGEPHTNLGVLAWSAGQKDEALGFLERGFVLSPTNSDAINLYHKAITDMGRFERAEPFFLEAKTIYPANKRISFLLIDLLIHQEKHHEALHEIQQAMLTFGIDDDVIAAALVVSGKIETTELRKKSREKATLSLAMIVKNEEEHIAKCLWSAKPIVDEMIVVDTGSFDRTKDISRAFGAKVYDYAWNNDFSEARNYALSLSSSDWILVLDADEVISPIDYAQLTKTINKNLSKPTAYRFTTRNYTKRLNVDGWNPNDGKYPLEQAGNGWYPSGKVRLFKRDQRIRFVNPIHECVEPTIIEAGIRIKSCSIPIHHYGPLSSHEKIQEKRKAYYLLSKRKVEEKGDDRQAIYELALVAAELGHYDEAIALWERFFQLDATMPPEFIHSAHINMGYVYTKLGRYQEAMEVSIKLLGLNPRLKEAVVNHANCMIWLDAAEKVIPPLEDLVKQIPDYIPALSLLAAAYLLCGQAGRAQDCLKGLRKRGFDTASYLLDQARILRFLERVEHARTLLEASLHIRDDEEGRRLLEECSKPIKGDGA
jgi:O-antigen biosynthesis protein